MFLIHSDVVPDDVILFSDDVMVSSLCVSASPDEVSSGSWDVVGSGEVSASRAGADDDVILGYPPLCSITLCRCSQPPSSPWRALSYSLAWALSSRMERCVSRVRRSKARERSETSRREGDGLFSGGVELRGTREGMGLGGGARRGAILG